MDFLHKLKVAVFKGFGGVFEGVIESWEAIFFGWLKMAVEEILVFCIYLKPDLFLFFKSKETYFTVTPANAGVWPELQYRCNEYFTTARPRHAAG